MLFFKKKRNQEEQALIDFLERVVRRIGEEQKITTKHSRKKNERGNFTQTIIFTFEDKELYFYKEFDGQAPIYFSINNPDFITNYKHDKEIDKLLGSVYYGMLARILTWKEQKQEEENEISRKEILNFFK